MNLNTYTGKKLVWNKIHNILLLLEIKLFFQLKMTHNAKAILGIDLKRIICHLLKSSDHSWFELILCLHQFDNPVFVFLLQADSNKTRIDEANQRATKMLGSG